MSDHPVTPRRTRGPARKLTAEQIKWMVVARAEGMPSTWVAETLQLSPDVIRKRAPMPEGAYREWAAAWGVIRHNPALLALHRAFASGIGDKRASA